MFRTETDDACRLVHAPCYVPNVEVLARVHYKELAKSVHETRRSRRQFFVLPVVEHRAPVNFDNGELARVAPDGDGRRVCVVVDSKKYATL